MNTIETAYQEAVDYLYRFVDYSLVRNFRNSPEKFDLGRMRDLMAMLRNPHQQYPVIHVAGTKGKGSTAAFIASSLRAQGYRVGVYTSPHLYDFTERFQVNGEPISHAELVELVDLLRPLAEKIDQITWFELTTAIAFEWFARRQVEFAVIEVGLGGRLDATNIVDPLVSVIASLSMDHMAVLGDTLAKIAFEKAGIIKPGRPVLAAPQKEEAQAVLEEAAVSRGCRLISIGRDYQLRSLSRSLEGQSFEVWRSGERPETLVIPLLGLHQAENAALAYAVLDELRAQGVAIDPEAVRRGFATVYWPGRFELLRKNPPVIVDSAHNRDSSRRLRQTVEDYLPEWPVVLIFGASEDKDISGILDELLPRVREVIATQSIHPRAMDAEKIVRMAEERGRPARAVVPAEEALEAALLSAGSGAAVLATGSLFIAAAVREIWQKRNETV